MSGENTNKSIQDTFADTANEAVTHALELVKSGCHSAAHEALNFAERLSLHVQRIEDHDAHTGVSTEPRVAKNVVGPDTIKY